MSEGFDDLDDFRSGVDHQGARDQDDAFLAQRPSARESSTEFHSAFLDDFRSAVDHQGARDQDDAFLAQRPSARESSTESHSAFLDDFRSAVDHQSAQGDPNDLLAQINALGGAGGGSLRQGQSLSGGASMAPVSQHVSQVSGPAPQHASIPAQIQPQPAQLNVAALRAQADASQAALNRRRANESEALGMRGNDQDDAAIGRVVGIDAGAVPAYLSKANRRMPAAMNKKAIANSMFGVISQDATSAPTSGAGATAHAIGRGVMRTAETAGRLQDFLEIGTFAGQSLGSSLAGTVADVSGMVGANIGVGDASLSTLHQIANAAGQIGQAGTKAAINAFDDPLKVAVRERADANLANATGHMDIERIRAQREKHKAANAGNLPDQLPRGARFGPSVWQNTVGRIKAEQAKTKVLQSHGFTATRSFTQDETAAALGATVNETQNGDGVIERELRGQDSSEQPVTEATTAQRVKANVGRRFQDIGQVMQGEDASEALKDGNFGQAAFRGAVSAGHAVGNAAFGTGLSEVPYLGDITNLVYNIGTGVGGAAIEHGSNALFNSSHAAVKAERLGKLHNAFNHEYREGDVGGGAEGEFVTPQERRNRYGLDWRERGQASKSDIVPQEQLTPGAIIRAEQGSAPASSHRAWQGKGRAGAYLGDTRSLDAILAQTRGQPVPGPLGGATLPAIPTGSGSDAESGWAPRKRGRWERFKRSVSRWWGTTKIGRRFKRG